MKLVRRIFKIRIKPKDKFSAFFISAKPAKIEKVMREAARKSGNDQKELIEAFRKRRKAYSR